MFDNIIGQQKITENLINDYSSGKLPHSILVSGPGFSGKLTIALELARILSCDCKSAEWSCRCTSCSLHRTLSHQNTLLLSPRSRISEIRASLSILKNYSKSFSRYMFIRSVKKIINRSSGILWDGSESNFKKSAVLLNEIEELLSSIHPDFNLSHKQAVASAEEIEKKINGLIKNRFFTSITIDMIRRASFWAHTSSDFNKKIIIIDGADNLSESARNALLKILEEPPDPVYIILLAVHKGSILPTILSRVRNYFTAPRSIIESQKVLEKIFRCTQSEYDSIRQFFLAYSDLNLDEVKNDCSSFIKNISDQEESYYKISSLSQKYKDHPEDFLEELIFTMEKILKQSGSSFKIEKWYNLVMKNYLQNKRYNSSSEMILENVLYGLCR